MRLSELFHTVLPSKPVVITFDDGYENFFSNALPVLARNGFTSTVFLVANQIGGLNAWDAGLGDVEEKLMDRQQIRKAESLGTEFGSHTLDHADLQVCGPDEAWKQIADSRCHLETELNIPIQTFCYPYGRKTPQVVEMVRSAGYRSAVTTDKGINTRESDRYTLKRINVRSDTWTPVLLLKLLRGHRGAR